MKPAIHFIAALFLATLSVRSSSAATGAGAAPASGGTGTTTAPGAAPSAAPATGNQPATVVSPVPNAATPPTGNVPAGNVPAGNQPAPLITPVPNAAIPPSPNTAAPGNPMAPAPVNTNTSGASVNTQPGTGVNPTGQIPVAGIRAAILNPAGNSAGGALPAGQTAAPGTVPVPNVPDLQVTSQNGAVILTGTAVTQQDKDAAGIRAAAAAGGAQVINNIAVP